MNDLTQNEVTVAGLGELDGRGRSKGRSNDNGKDKGLKNAVRNEMGASRFRKQFLERINLLPKDIQQALKNGKAQISDAPYYATAEIKGTRSELIKLSVSEELGITNLDNGKLGKDRHLTVSGIKVLYDANSIDGTFTDTFPADLMNGEWEMELNGKKVFEKQPMRRFFDGFYGYNTQKPFGLYILNNPKTINPQTPIEFNVNLPNEVTGFLKVFLEGTTVYGY